MTHELPLVLFTICAQMSAGSFIVLGLIHVFGAKEPHRVMDKVTDPALYAIGPLLVLGLVVSTFHLGSPLRAPNSLRHLNSSWLSREILVGLLFCAAGALFALLQYLKKGTPLLRRVLAVVTAALGVLLVFVISRVYSLRTVPAWSTWYTPLRFFITTFLLGGLAVATAIVVAAHVRRRRGTELLPGQPELVGRCVQWIALGGLVLVGVKFIAMPAYFGHLMGDSIAGRASLHVLTQTDVGWSAAEGVLGFLGMVTLGFLLSIFGRDKSSRWAPRLAVLAFVLMLAAEVIGRMLFYASMKRVGM